MERGRAGCTLHPSPCCGCLTVTIVTRHIIVHPLTLEAPRQKSRILTSCLCPRHCSSRGASEGIRMAVHTARSSVSDTVSTHRCLSATSRWTKGAMIHHRQFGLLWQRQPPIADNKSAFSFFWITKGCDDEVSCHVYGTVS